MDDWVTPLPDEAVDGEDLDDCCGIEAVDEGLAWEWDELCRASGY